MKIILKTAGTQRSNGLQLEYLHIALSRVFLFLPNLAPLDYCFVSDILLNMSSYTQFVAEVFGQRPLELCLFESTTDKSYIFLNWHE